MVTDPVHTLLASQPVLGFVRAFFAQHPEADLFFVGGAVRDALLGRPTSDFDFVVRGMSAEDLQAWFETRGRMELVGRDFGVFKFLPEGFSPSDHDMVDIALPRTERSLPGSLGGYKEFDVQTDAHLPIEDDLARRDFTVNAMAYDCRTHQLIDPFGGKKDLEARLVRAVGEAGARFDEDLSRLLRAIRFAAQLSFTIESETQTAIKSRASKLMQTRAREDGTEEFVVPRETLGKELAKAFASNPSAAASLLMDAGILAVLIPELAPHIENETYLEPLARQALPSPAVSAALLLRALESDQAKSIVQNLGLHTLPKHSRLHVHPEDVKWMIAQVRDEEGLRASLKAPGSKFETMYMNGRSGFFLPFLQAMGMQEIVDEARARCAEILARWSVTNHKHIPRLISGDDVLALGVPHGPRVRELLNLVRDGQLDGNIMSRKQAMDVLKSHL